MKLEKAIEILEDQVYLDPGFCSSKVISAFKLGIEALIFYQTHRSRVIPPYDVLLPGETKE